jgi:hypothetical protein
MGSKLIYRPFGMAFSALAGIAAGAAYKQVWRRVSDTKQPPKPTESDYSWRAVLSAAALQGAVFGLVKAAADRSGARAFEKLTGSWPGD